MMAHLHMRPSEPKPFNQPVSSRCRYTTPSDPKLSDPLLRLISERFLQLRSSSSLLLINPFVSIYSPCWPVSVTAGLKSDGLFAASFSVFPFTKHLFIKFLLTQNPRNLCFHNVPKESSRFQIFKLCHCLTPRLFENEDFSVRQMEGTDEGRFPVCADKSNENLMCANVPVSVAELLLAI